MLTEATRSSLHIYGTPRGSISGPLVLVADGLRVDCEEGGVAGMNVLVVEKKSVFLLLMELDFPKKHKCVLITGSSMPDVATRTAICKLHELLGVPVYCFVDANAHGLRIYSIYKVGSRELFLENTGLALSSIELIGFLSEDVKEVNKSSLQLLSKNDKEVLKGMLEMKYLSEDLKKHVTYMQEYGFKAQIEAIQDDHGSAALEEYITRKIAALEEGMLE